MPDIVATATVKALVWRFRGGWSLAKPDNLQDDGVLLPLNLSLQGDRKSGYHFIIEPEGLFAADHHCDELDDAIAESAELFGVEMDF